MVSQPQDADFLVSFSEQMPVVLLPARLSVLEAVAFKETCQQLFVATPPPSKLVLDFSQTVFMDSSAVGALVNNVRTAQQKGIELVLRNVQPQVMAVLSITGLDQVLTVERAGPTPLNTDRKARVDNQLPTTHPSVRSWVKRALDVIGALVGLAITAILLIPIGIAIKLDSPGPIFFSQIRCGWMGRRFRLWKLRSMCSNAEALKSQVENKVEGPLFKNDNDPRITKVGRFLRRTSLDELPQFWNVLKGDMSLVGTRPPTPDEVERYEVPEWQRLDVKPGMTGEWQVNGRSKITKFEDVIKMDLQYQKNWSLVYDLKLIVKTVLVLFRKNSGAM
ncbi:anti-sigma factor antagonist [Ancylothrix sp. C2]|uniref:anti-sigma factor antagonist n=1 Tax=Ancylothrix sp. D3o TaxID=2953691 RepID=UPI0021BA88D2|nr:anti-sigma factor antagonist [Ancylothrix sp. D3o]MCT7950261.1 anti-sigma factor antagonist [Ancylothrix sp. D3o]